ncbi:hypothetical protein BgiBS90_005314 [Biomphalaria glabrata]|nr:hypothetical protein BgiBS90_005314 [Biomphalaria glabrata]
MTYGADDRIVVMQPGTGYCNILHPVHGWPPLFVEKTPRAVDIDESRGMINVLGIDLCPKVPPNQPVVL